jgi:hypothetical protein
MPERADKPLSDKLSITGDEDGWQVFARSPKAGGLRLLFRSRAGWPPVRAYALQHPMMRLRCALRSDQVRDDGLPRSTKDMDDYEDRLVTGLTEANAEVYLIASVTGGGNRDLYLTARDLDDIRTGVNAARVSTVDTFTLQLAPLKENEEFLDFLSLSADEVKEAVSAGRAHHVSDLNARGLFGKLFGRNAQTH